jgi:hypothetical protein
MHTQAPSPLPPSLPLPKYMTVHRYLPRRSARGSSRHCAGAHLPRGVEEAPHNNPISPLPRSPSHARAAPTAPGLKFESMSLAFASRATLNRFDFDHLFSIAAIGLPSKPFMHDACNASMRRFLEHRSCVSPGAQIMRAYITCIYMRSTVHAHTHTRTVSKLVHAQHSTHLLLGDAAVPFPTRGRGRHCPGSPSQSKAL